jgi:hypothetical protein
MLLNSPALNGFIKAYDLKKENNQVCFEAAVSVSCGEKEVHCKSRVVIVYAVQKNIDAVYILEPMVAQSNLPELYRSDRDFFTYYSGKYLVINGRYGHQEIKEYMVLIRPHLNGSH